MGKHCHINVIFFLGYPLGQGWFVSTLVLRSGICLCINFFNMEWTLHTRYYVVLMAYTLVQWQGSPRQLETRLLLYISGEISTPVYLQNLVQCLCLDVLSLTIITCLLQLPSFRLPISISLLPIAVLRDPLNYNTFTHPFSLLVSSSIFIHKTSASHRPPPIPTSPNLLTIFSLHEQNCSFNCCCLPSLATLPEC